MMINLEQARRLMNAQDTLEDLENFVSAKVLQGILEKKTPIVIYTQHAVEAEKLLRANGFTVLNAKYGEVMVFVG